MDLNWMVKLLEVHKVHKNFKTHAQFICQSGQSDGKDNIRV
jgi:hypothetical protein